MKPRECSIYEWKTTKDHTSFEKKCVGKGLFLQFGCDYEEFENGVGIFSTALVEMPDGSIKNIEVELIKFEEATK